MGTTLRSQQLLSTARMVDTGARPYLVVGNFGTIALTILNCTEEVKLPLVKVRAEDMDRPVVEKHRTMTTRVASRLLVATTFIRIRVMILPHLIVKEITMDSELLFAKN